MITEQPFLPLFFNPEDEKLWEQIQKLPPEKRAETVKQALYEFFQIHFDLQSDKVIASEQVPLELASDDEEDEEPLTQSVTENELSLESLFEASPQAQKPDPLKNLLSVIGEEDDEEVLKLLSVGQKSNTENQIKTQTREFVAHTAKHEVPVGKEAKGSNGGLAYLLHNVIGEEEDEEVLHFFENIAKKKEE